MHTNYANETDRDISDDYRPVQPLNQRVVMTNSEEGLKYNTAQTRATINTNTLFSALLLLAMFIHF